MKIFAFIFILLFSVSAQAAPLNTSLPLPPPPDIAAKAYLLVDFNSGQALVTVRPNDRIDPTF